jgi:hypothetical protein
MHRMGSSRTIRNYFRIFDKLGFGNDLRSIFKIVKIGSPTAKNYPVTDLK